MYFLQVRLGFERLQAQVRSRQMRYQYERMRVATLVIQKHARSFIARREYQRKREAVIVLQAHTRGMLARKAIKKKKRAVRSFGFFVSSYLDRLCFVFLSVF